MRQGTQNTTEVLTDAHWIHMTIYNFMSKKILNKNNNKKNTTTNTTTIATTTTNNSYGEK